MVASLITTRTHISIWRHGAATERIRQYLQMLESDELLGPSAVIAPAATDAMVFL